MADATGPVLNRGQHAGGDHFDGKVPRFEEFHLGRAQLRTNHRTLSREVIAEFDGETAAEDLPFQLVESVTQRCASG